MTSMEILNRAIEKTKIPSSQHTPKKGPTVVEAYRANELQDVETCLYVIAELLGEVKHCKELLNE
jgi:hypothetical protein